jgi:hypothetical protein
MPKIGLVYVNTMNNFVCKDFYVEEDGKLYHYFIDEEDMEQKIESVFKSFVDLNEYYSRKSQYRLVFDDITERAAFGTLDKTLKDYDMSDVVPDQTDETVAKDLGKDFFKQEIEFPEEEKKKFID